MGLISWDEYGWLKMIGPNQLRRVWLVKLFLKQILTKKRLLKLLVKSKKKTNNVDQNIVQLSKIDRQILEKNIVEFKKLIGQTLEQKIF